MTIDKKWFQDKIEKFLLEDEANKMTGVDGSYIFDTTPLFSSNVNEFDVSHFYPKSVKLFNEWEPLIE